MTRNHDHPVIQTAQVDPSKRRVANDTAGSVRRISVGSALVRYAHGSLLRAAAEIRDQGTFGFAADAVPYATLNALLA